MVAQQQQQQAAGDIESGECGPAGVHQQRVVHTRQRRWFLLSVPVPLLSLIVLVLVLVQRGTANVSTGVDSSLNGSQNCPFVSTALFCRVGSVFPASLSHCFGSPMRVCRTSALVSHRCSPLSALMSAPGRFLSCLLNLRSSTSRSAADALLQRRNVSSPYVSSH